MIINIDAPIKQKEIVELLEGKGIKYLGHPNNRITTIQFSVTEDVIQNNVVNEIKKIIKETEFGKNIALRVLEEGKNW